MRATYLYGTGSGTVPPGILEGKVAPGKVFDRTVGFDGIPEGYRAMHTRESLKVLITP